MKERIILLRKLLGLTQEKFAERLGIKRTAISNYEVGRNKPVDSVVMLICKEFTVNEDWLRNGKGSIFIQQTKSKEIVDFLGELIPNADFRKRFIIAVSKLSIDEWKVIANLIDEMQKN